DGEGMLLDSNNRILYHPNPARLMESYTGRTGEQILFYDEAAPDSTRRLVYYQPVLGQSWSVVLAIPARRSQQLALNIAVPLLGMVLLLFVAGVIVLRFGLSVVTASLQTLGAEVKRIAGGQLDHPLPLDGEDEVGQLRRAFEQMRVSLKSRLDELNMLLNVSQGVASSLEIKDAIKPILDSALVTGACSARLVLLPVSAGGLDSDNGHLEYFGHGNSTDQYQYLDEQILELTQKQEKLVLNNLARVRLLTFIPGRPRPEALLALALRHENMYYGTLWLAYDRPHTFVEDELRFMITLAGQAALAAANTRLFQSAEIGRQRLAAILASTPDPVLVTDQQNHLLLSNPAAWQVLGMGTESGDGRAIETVINQKDLVKLLRSSEEERKSAEVTLLNGRVYLATTSSVFADGLRVGRVCVLRDITHFKELDKLKSEFVATVSHDLRSPLTLMRGYATMLEMVGELNEQQTNYVRKIVIAVESMTKLVNNLLDLGRIEAGIDLQLEMVLVQDVVEKVTGALQPTAIQKQITLSTEVPSATIPLVEADSALLQQALSNLVENGIKYTDRGGKVNVSVQPRADGMVFAVSDTGIGIAPVDQPRLFEKFYRGAQRETKKPAGTGLGLTIVKSIAERHGGKVWVESQLGKGSTFYFVIPLNHSQNEAPKAKEIKPLKE
ncbi:MAG: ATP-binding protein, partial [Omnitrophica WOR_2 bacterium]